MLRAFLRDGALYTLPALVSRGLALFLLPLYTRVLSPGDYGSLELITVLATIVNLTIALEVSQGLARFYAAEPDRARRVAYASSALWFTVACYSGFLLLALLFSAQFARLVLGQAGQETVFRIGLFYIWANGLFYLVQNQFRWELRAVQYAIVSILMIVVTAAVAVWLAYVQRWGLRGILVGQLSGCLAGAAYGVLALRGTFRPLVDRERLAEMLRFSWPLVPSSVAVWVSSYVDRVMINHFLGIDEVGIYSIGFRLASIAALAVAGFQGALTPLVYTHYREPGTPGELARIFRLFLVVALVLYLLITALAPDLLVLLTTEAFYGGAAVVPLLVPAVLLAQMYIFAPGLAIAKKTHYILWINVAGALVNALLNVLLIPAFGIRGAAAAMLLGSLLVFCLYMLPSQRFYNVPHRWGPLLVAVAAAVALLLGVDNLAAAAPQRWIGTAVAVGLFLALCLPLGMLPRRRA